MQMTANLLGEGLHVRCFCSPPILANDVWVKDNIFACHNLYIFIFVFVYILPWGSLPRSVQPPMPYAGSRVRHAEQSRSARVGGAAGSIMTLRNLAEVSNVISNLDL